MTGTLPATPGPRHEHHYPLRVGQTGDSAMRKLTLALAIGLVFGIGFVALTPTKASAASYQAKVVIVVGQTQSVTGHYIDLAKQAAGQFRDHGASVTEVYSPNATWGAVKAAAKGANVLVYMGHGSGYPNPYVSFLQQKADNGMGLDGPTSGKTYYYGEAYMAQLSLAPNAIVILNHLCYASGNSEPGRGRPSVSDAHMRIEGYAGGFLRAGARAVIAEGLNDIGYYIDQLFTGHKTVEAMWKSAPSFNDHVVTWQSGRNPGYWANSDPDLDHPASDGDYYYRSMVGLPGLTTDQVISGQFGTLTLKSGTYYPVSPIQRVVDTRLRHEGPCGVLLAGSGVNYQIAGLAGIPSNAIAITANITVTNQTAKGWIFVGPRADTSPGESTVNFPVGDNRANGVTVPLSPEGTVGVWYGARSGNTTDFIIDVTGYYLEGTGGATYRAFGPERIMDTREPGNNPAFLNGQPQKITVAGVKGLPSSGLVAVTGNLTAVRPAVRGYVALGPDPTTTPGWSTVNFPARDIRANNVVVPVNADGTVAAVYIADPRLGTSSSAVDLVFDITGYFTASGGSKYHVLVPSRIMDTREPVPTSFHVFHANQAQTLHVWNAGGVPTSAIAITANLTVTQQTYQGYAALGPQVDASVGFSNLNFPYGDDRANGVIVPLSDAGSLDVIYIARSGNTAHLILDVSGYFAP
jgi:hypothetical protein